LGKVEFEVETQRLKPFKHLLVGSVSNESRQKLTTNQTESYLTGIQCKRAPSPTTHERQPDISRPIPYNLHANGGDRLRQGFGRPTDAMPGYLMQLVKKRREKTIANSNEFALAA